MSETSIAQEASTATDEPRTWYFTFGGGHVHPTTGENLGRAYVVVVGTQDEAIAKMFAAFGNRWAFQYATYAEVGIDEFDMHQVEMPEPAAEAESRIWDPEFVDPSTLAGASPVELVDTEVVPDPELTAAQKLAGDLRAMAAMLDASPDVCDLDNYDGLSYFLQSTNIYVQQRAQVAAYARAAMRTGAKVDKHQDDQWAGVDITFGRVGLHVYARREEVCQKIVKGTHEVTEEIPDPEALKAVPKVTVTKTVEDVEWVCMPLLADPPKQLAAAVASDAELAEVA